MSDEKKPSWIKRFGIGVLQVVLFPLALFTGVQQTDSVKKGESK